MTPQPILMSDPMVLAVLAGNKSETRRIWSDRYAALQPGQLLWVREAWRCRNIRNGQAQIEYRADRRAVWLPVPGGRLDEGESPGTIKDQPPGTMKSDPHRDAPFGNPMFMPKFVSRLTLRVERVTQQKLRDIDGTDCLHEGLRGKDLIDQYRRLWDSLHKDEPSQWAHNPQVAVVVFTVEQRNVLELTKRSKAA